MLLPSLPPPPTQTVLVSEPKIICNFDHVLVQSLVKTYLFGACSSIWHNQLHIHSKYRCLMYMASHYSTPPYHLPRNYLIDHSSLHVPNEYNETLHYLPP